MRKMGHAHQTIRALSHYRHDFLNELQLIKSYAALGRMDKVDSVIGRVAYRAEQESRISNLRIPVFAEKILTYNWDSPVVPIEIEVNLEHGDWNSVEAKALFLLEQVTSWLEAEAEPGQDHQLLVCIQETERKELIMDYSAEEIAGEQLSKAELLISSLPAVIESEITEKSLYIRTNLIEER